MCKRNFMYTKNSIETQLCHLKFIVFFICVSLEEVCGDSEGTTEGL